MDVFATALVLVGFFLLWQKNGFYIVPRQYLFLWGATLAVLTVSIFLSDSPGASIQVLIRYILAFVIFGLANSVNTKVVAEIIEKTLIVVGAVSGVVASVFLFVPKPTWLPSMNLLYPSYGHNHVADVLLFVFPWAVYAVGFQRPILYLLSGSVFCGLVTSFARGAWVVVSVFLVFMLFRSPASVIRKPIIISSIIFTLLLFISFVLPWAKKYSPLFSFVPSTITRIAVKGDLSNDPRFLYWQQGKKMILERPLFGGGAGTFFFNSKRLQTHTDSYSWFAHSFPLQTVAEQGIVGATPIFLLLGFVMLRFIEQAKNFFRQQDALSRLSLGAILSFVYSFIEFNMSFIVVWMLFWFIAGLAARSGNHAVSKDNNKTADVLSVTVLIIFYALLTAQNFVFAFFPQRPDIAFYFAPFDVVAAKTYVTSPTISIQGLRLASLLHKNDPEILDLVIDAHKRLNNAKIIPTAFLKLLALDPLTEEYHKKYVRYLVDTKDYDSVTFWIQKYGSRFLHPSGALVVSHVDVPESYIMKHPERSLELFDTRYSHAVRYRRFFYNLGLSYLSIDPVFTRECWGVASVLTPELSHVWVERAGLEQHTFSNFEGAWAIMSECMDNPIARTHCEDEMSKKELFPPGKYEKEINEK